MTKIERCTTQSNNILKEYALSMGNFLFIFIAAETGDKNHRRLSNFNPQLGNGF